MDNQPIFWYTQGRPAETGDLNFIESKIQQYEYVQYLQNDRSFGLVCMRNKPQNILRIRVYLTWKQIEIKFGAILILLRIRKS